MYAKTLYKPNPPESVKDKIKAIMNGKLPHFFIYAKSKEESKVKCTNSNCVNRLKQIVPRHKFKFSPGKGGKFDYHMLMNNPTLIWSERCEEIVDEYKDCLRDFKYAKYNKDEYDNVHDYQFQTIREKMFNCGEDITYVVDSIILGIFGRSNSRRKVVFWGGFGDIVLNNIRHNLSKEDTTLCTRCWGRYDVKSHSDGVCPFCGYKHQSGELLVCDDCGVEYYENKSSRKKAQLCPNCYREYRNKSTL